MIYEDLGTQLTFSTAFHPHTDGQSERMIQMLEVMLRAYVIDFGDHWNQFLLLCEFSYNKSYYSRIDMAPFEVGDVKPLGIDLVNKAQVKGEEYPDQVIDNPEQTK